MLNPELWNAPAMGDLLRLMEPVELFDEKKQRWQIKQKITTGCEACTAAE
jgi:hypothetical protein